MGLDHTPGETGWHRPSTERNQPTTCLSSVSVKAATEGARLRNVFVLSRRAVRGQEKNNCDHVVVKDNVFDSDVAPEWVAWIVTKDNQHPVEHHGNEVICPATVPMLNPLRSSGE